MNGPFFGGGEMNGPGFPGVRVTPNQGYTPTPNSEPMGAETGTPVRTRWYSRPVAVGASQIIVSGTRENKVALLTPPLVGFTFYVGEAGVTPDTGMALIPGQVTEFPMPGFQELWVVHDCPVSLRLQVQITPILAAERERRL